MRAVRTIVAKLLVAATTVYDLKNMKKGLVAANPEKLQIKIRGFENLSTSDAISIFSDSFVTREVVS